MRAHQLLAIMTWLTLSLAVVACKQEAGERAAPGPAVQAMPAASGAFTGAIVETMDASSYTYVHLRATSGEEVWVAGPKTAVEVGQVLTIPGGHEMRDFHSASLDRTFPRLIMAPSLGADPAAKGASPHGGMGGAAKGAMGASPHGGTGGAAAEPKASPHGGMGGAMANAVAGDEAPGAPKLAPTIMPGAVARAEGEAGRTVAEVYAQAAALAGKAVAVRGVVVKASNGIMDRNWIHVQDGSGTAKGGDHDLTVTSDATAKPGDRVLVTGTLAADKDFGMGYHYKVLLEQATVTVEP